MNLYTSLVRLKQSMNDGRLPPMTPVPASAHQLIDPAFTIGLGALYEDSEKGLRCPIRECGGFYHNLGLHLRASHGSAGGSTAVRSALDIPLSAPLLSQRLLETHRDNSARSFEQTRRSRPFTLPVHGKATEARRRQSRTIKADRLTVGARNLRDTCLAQLSHKLIDLHHRLGRTPSSQEARTLNSPGFVAAVTRSFGTWDAALAHCGLQRFDRGARQRVSRDKVLESLSAYFAEHGCLPTQSQAYHPKRTPIIPTPPTIMRVMATKSWPEAMRRAASLLNIYGGRYGLPTHLLQKHSAA